MKSRVNQCL